MRFSSVNIRSGFCGGAGVKRGGGNGYVAVQDTLAEFLGIRKDPLGRGNGVIRAAESALSSIDAGRQSDHVGGNRVERRIAKVCFPISFPIFFFLLSI